MKASILLLVLLISGCTTNVPVNRSFPEVPSILMRQCLDLQKLPADTTKLSEVLTTVTKNYSQHAECQLLLEKWQEWYKIQKIIYESAN